MLVNYVNFSKDNSLNVIFYLKIHHFMNKIYYKDLFAINTSQNSQQNSTLQNFTQFIVTFLYKKTKIIKVSR